MAFHNYLEELHKDLAAWDPTRLFIANAGYGEGREGDLCDVHRYWGWYYNTFLTYYNLRDNIFGVPEKQQPITFSECVGSFTGPSGEFNLIVRKQLGAQLNWTGHSPEQRKDALNYQAYLTKTVAETFRRLRPMNPRLSGLMPFTTLFFNWSGVESFEAMQPKPAMHELAVAYQPILLSWELWATQVYAGSTVHPRAHLVNDRDAGTPLKDAHLRWRLTSKSGRKVAGGELAVGDVPYYATATHTVSIPIPERLSTGDYLLVGELFEGKRTLSRNETRIFIASRPSLKPLATTRRELLLYDPKRITAAAFERRQISFKLITHSKTFLLPRSFLEREHAMKVFQRSLRN